MLRPDSSFSICRLLVAITAILIIGLVTFQNSIISGIRSLQPSHLSSPAATTEGKVSHKFAGAIDGGWASRPLSPKGGLLWVQYNETFSVTWGITVFHALHCVDMLRAYMLNDTGVHLHETEEPTAAPDMDTGVHLSHCLDYISQALLCSADETLEPPVLEFDNSGNVIRQSVGGHGYQHSCRAVDHLWEIVEISEQKPLSPFDWKDGDTVSSVFKSSDDHGGPAVQRTKRHGQDHNHGIRTKVHGAILFLTFSVFLPLGVFLIRSGTGNGFVLHWVIQLGAMIASIGAIMIMLVRSWSSIKSGNAGTHQMLGFAIFIGLFIQAALGYTHHIIYKRSQRRTAITVLHDAIGWCVICGGWINTALGLQGAGSSNVAMVIWLLFLGLVSLAIVFATQISQFCSAIVPGARGSNHEYWKVDQDCYEETVERLMMSEPSIGSSGMSG